MVFLILNRDNSYLLKLQNIKAKCKKSQATVMLLHMMCLLCVRQDKLSCWRVKKQIISSWATVMALTGWSTMSVGGLITQSWILLHPTPPASCWNPESKDGPGSVSRMLVLL